MGNVTDMTNMAVTVMNIVNRQQAEREARWLQANREELIERIARAVPKDGTVEPLKGLYLTRISVPGQPVHSVLEPSLCVIAQGSKEILQGNDRYLYDSAHYLLATIGLPNTARVLDASKERPYLSLRLELRPALVASVMAEASQFLHSLPSLPSRHTNTRAIAVSPLDERLLDAVVRLMRLLDSPAEAQVLLPLINREIIYRLLLGEQGVRLRHLVMEGYAPSIARAVKRLRQDFDKPIRIEQIARELGMSVSSFHHRFKAITGMSPLQFQKQLRLPEARRLMLDEGLEAANAAARVGYYDASHFSREYKDLFGLPPMRDIQRLKHEPLQSAGVG